jgi:hypothetical protein
MLALIGAASPVRPTDTTDGDHDAIVLLRQYLEKRHAPTYPGYSLHVISICTKNRQCVDAPYVSNDYLKYPVRVACYGARCYWINLAKRTVSPFHGPPR